MNTVSVLEAGVPSIRLSDGTVLFTLSAVYEPT